MCSVPWISESERADYYQELYNEQLAICDRLDRHLQRYIEEVRKLERERDDILADTQVEVSERLEAAIKAEAYKEFAENAKEELHEWVGADNSISYPRIKRVLDNLLKEMVGDNDGNL